MPSYSKTILVIFTWTLTIKLLKLCVYFEVGIPKFTLGIKKNREIIMKM